MSPNYLDVIYFRETVIRSGLSTIKVIDRKTELGKKSRKKKATTKLSQAMRFPSKDNVFENIMKYPFFI